MRLFILAVIFLAIASCTSPEPSVLQERSDYDRTESDFSNYWYSGKAELASYQLFQNRYGEERNGSAVLVFVTEPFSSEKHVKLDDPESPDNVTVMKLNFTKKFQTGIYPYSMMTSVFTPVDGKASFKTTTTVQEWCGHTFTQLNFEPAGYVLRSFSYFESEGDRMVSIGSAYPEDALWNRIRLDPDKLPVGRFNLIPSTFYYRFTHTPSQLEEAKLSLEKGENTTNYRIEYLDTDRRLIITFENDFPHKITGWEEHFNGELQSRAELKQILHTDYWKKNSKQYEYLYDSLTSY